MPVDPGFDLSLEGKTVCVLGAAGMVGRALVRSLEERGVKYLAVTRSDVDLTEQAATFSFLSNAKPDIVIVAAAKVGGIHANRSEPARFLYDNASIALNVIEGAHRAGIDRLLMLGSSCIYPKSANLPISEDSLLTGALEPTNEWYAVAKIAAVKMCDAYRKQFGRHYISAMPCNLYGPGDNYDPTTSHVLPALIRKFVTAEEKGVESVSLWGDGTPLREFLHTEDLANACLLMLERFDGLGPLNIGTGEEISIFELARLIARGVGYRGTITFDTTMPNGTMRKVMNSSRIKELGWAPKISLEDGINRAIAEYKQL